MKLPFGGKPKPKLVVSTEPEIKKQTKGYGSGGF